MQHSQIKQKFERVKIFAKKDPNNVNKVLQIFKFKDNLRTDITPTYTVDDLNPGYYSTEFDTPNEDCYILILFCDSPMVIRVGEPTLEFIMWNKPGRVIPYIHYDEFGVNVSEDVMIEIGYGFYYYTPVISELGYVEIYGKPSVINIPYCSPHIGVPIDIEWAKKVIKLQFGVKSIKQKFSIKTLKHNINIVQKKQSFNRKTIKKSFQTKIIKQEFKAKVCS